MRPVRRVGHAGVGKGWRKAVADRVAPNASRIMPLTTDQVRTALGIVFVGLSAKYVLGTVRRFRRAGR